MKSLLRRQPYQKSPRLNPPPLTSRDLMSNVLRHPLLFAGLIVITVLVFGTAGYMLIEDWPLLDSLFMTIITMSTIGYGEVRILSPAGRVFTIGLIVIGVIIASYAVTTIIELFTAQGLMEQIRYRRRRRELDKVCNHCVICGFGRLGRSLARELQVRGCPIIVIDINEETVERCRQMGFLAILGNAADEHILDEAGIDRARSLVAAANSDAENVFIVLTAKSLNPNLQIISRCNSEPSIPKLEKAGVNTVISPHAIAGRRIAQLLTRPNVLSFLDGILEFGDHQMQLEEFIIGEKSPLAGLTLREAKLKVAVLAVTHPEQTLLTHPNADTKLLPGAGIIVMGIEQELHKLAELVKG
ncbi:MAG: potassium channel protein [Anaerolineae bacterium]|nr:potassium channel protein [Anaerolineae bacterium]